MQDFFLFAMLGLGAGSVYAILGLGLVLVYRGSGVVNFAHGALALFATSIYVDLTDRGLSTTVAVVVTLAISALGGAGLYWVMVRPLRHATTLGKIVATLGLLLTLEAATTLVFGSETVQVPSILPTDTVEVFGVSFGRNRLWLFGITVALTVALWALYRFTKFGRVTQAAAESEKGAVLLGYSPNVIGAVNWSLACMLAAIAGILIAPITSLAATTFVLLIIPALAAALLGRFSSFGLTALAGILLGVAQSEITRYQSDLPSWFPQQGLKESLPFLVIIVAMVITGKFIPPRGELSTGRPPLATPARPHVIPIAVLVIVTMGAYVLFAGHASYEAALTASIIGAIIALSLVVVTGYVGQISLAQMTFAGIGAFAVSKLAEENGVPFLASILLAALIAVPVGILVGLPALRVRGANLAIVTIGAAVAIDSFVFQNTNWSGGIDGLGVPEPKLFGWSIDAAHHPQRFGAFALVVLLVCMYLVSNLRRGRMGRRLLSVRDNERSGAASGVSVSATKLQAFALSAFIAALGGAVLAYQTGKIAFERFAPLQSVFFVAVAYIGGIGAVSGAVLAGTLVTGGIAFALLGDLGDLEEWQGLLLGVLLIITVMTYPDGVAVAIQRGWRRLRRHTGNDATSRALEPRSSDASDGSVVAASRT
jgi:branched-chain amino acid transport system permease protein